MNGGYGYEFGDAVNNFTRSGINATTGAGVNTPTVSDGWLLLHHYLHFKKVMKDKYR
ncbi:hypothetical protein ACQKII_23765 [Lysinibacillus sp. NPDC048646]|uniref:hypothetical protein n=1 Tax=Lysinibacillus sp. NPDC048646 TaxID=3390574 RepID=UPI003D000A29